MDTAHPTDTAEHLPPAVRQLRAGIPDRYLTPEDLAGIFGVPKETVYAWRRKRTGPPGFRVGKHLRYDPATVHAWTRTRTHHTTGNQA